jgi:hypothetical protein
MLMKMKDQAFSCSTRSLSMFEEGRDKYGFGRELLVNMGKGRFIMMFRSRRIPWGTRSR